jgi:hypothetical protein
MFFQSDAGRCTPPPLKLCVSLGISTICLPSALWTALHSHVRLTQIQSWAPQTVLQPLRQSPANALVATFWCAALITCPLFMAFMVQVRCASEGGVVSPSQIWV